MYYFMRLIYLLCFAILTSFSSFSHAQSCQTLTGSANSDYYPYSWQSLTNPQKIEGAVPLLMHEIGKAIDKDIAINFVGPWARTQQEANAGNIDLISGAFFTDERATNWDFINPPITLIESVIWVREDHTFEFQTLADLKDKIGATVIDNSLGEEFDNYAKEHLTIHQLGNIAQAFKMLNNQRVDYVVYEKEPSKKTLKELEIAHIIALKKPVSAEKLYLVLSKKSPCNTHELRQQLTQALESAQQQNLIADFIEQITR